MKTGTIITTVVSVALVTGSVGFYGGLRYADLTLTEGARYVYGVKTMPPMPASVPFDKDAPPRMDPWRMAQSQARAYCQLVENAGSGAARITCSPYLPENTP